MMTHRVIQTELIEIDHWTGHSEYSPDKARAAP